MKYNTQLNARIPLSTYRELKVLSKKEKISFSEAVRVILEKGIRRTKKTTAKTATVLAS